MFSPDRNPGLEREDSAAAAEEEEETAEEEVAEEKAEGKKELTVKAI